MAKSEKDLGMRYQIVGTPWGTPYNRLYGEAPPERGPFFRLQVYERAAISLVGQPVPGSQKVGKTRKKKVSELRFPTPHLPLRQVKYHENIIKPRFEEEGRKFPRGRCLVNDTPRLTISPM